MNASLHFGEAVTRTAFDCYEAEADPFAENLQQRLLRRPAINADHGQIDRDIGFEAGVRQQHGHKFFLCDFRRLRLKDDANRCCLAGLITHRVEHAEHQGLEVLLLLRHFFLACARLRIGQRFDFREHLRGGNTVRQFVNDYTPLASRQFVDRPARAHAHAAATAGVGILDVTLA